MHDGEIDWAELERVTRLTTRFLDDVIEINPFPLPQVHEKVHANRRIGLGVMGWAEMLFELRYPLRQRGGHHLGEKVMTRISEWSTDESHKMAEERGAFPNFSRSIYKDGPTLRNSRAPRWRQPAPSASWRTAPLASSRSLRWPSSTA